MSTLWKVFYHHYMPLN